MLRPFASFSLDPFLVAIKAQLSQPGGLTIDGINSLLEEPNNHDKKRWDWRWLHKRDCCSLVPAFHPLIFFIRIHLECNGILWSKPYKLARATDSILIFVALRFFSDYGSSWWCKWGTSRVSHYSYNKQAWSGLWWLGHKWRKWWGAAQGSTRRGEAHSGKVLARLRCWI